MVFQKDFIYLLERNGRRKRERNIDMRNCSIASRMRPIQGPNQKPRRVPWLGIEPTTFCLAERHPTNWTTSVREGWQLWKILQLWETRPRMWHQLHKSLKPGSATGSCVYDKFLSPWSLSFSLCKMGKTKCPTLKILWGLVNIMKKIFSTTSRRSPKTVTVFIDWEPLGHPLVSDCTVNALSCFVSFLLKGIEIFELL